MQRLKPGPVDVEQGITHAGIDADGLEARLGAHEGLPGGVQHLVLQAQSVDVERTIVARGRLLLAAMAARRVPIL